MTSLGSQVASRRNNNLNIIRLVLALMVIFSHSFPVALGTGGDTRAEPLYNCTHRQESSGALAVHLFFLISGFLVTASWLRSKSLQDYLKNRILRIYPGFIVVMGVTAVLIWALCPEFRAAVLHPIDWWLLLLKDLVWLTTNSIRYQGIFAGNPFPSMANASLWTIPVEFLCYLTVLVIGFFGLFKRRFWFLVATLLGYEVYVLSVFNGAEEPVDECLICFLTGAVIWLWQDKIPFSKRMACGCLMVLLLSSQFRPWFSLTFPIMGGYCILWLAYGPRLILSGWAEKTDLSYGTYLYAFPIQQMLALNVAWRHPWVIFLLAVPTTLFAAWVSWKLVEKPFLALKSSTRMTG
jgi:peptidoglycan/LPS O-acetylase OafA/YrhL